MDVEKIPGERTLYNLFSCLVPGVVFVLLLGSFTDHALLQLLKENLIIGIFICYFVGLVAERFGSIIPKRKVFKRVESFAIERKIFKWIGFEKVERAEYSDFIRAANKDPKIYALTETGYMYRTTASIMVFLLIAKIFDMVYRLFLHKTLFFVEFSVFVGIVVVLFILFSLSYQKQVGLIKERVNACGKSNQ